MYVVPWEMMTTSLHALKLVPFPYVFQKKTKNSLLVYSVQGRRLLEFSDEASISFFRVMSRGHSVHHALRQLAQSRNVAYVKMKHEASDMLRMLGDCGVLSSREPSEWLSMECGDSEACLHLIGEMPDYFLRYVDASRITHLDSPLGVRYLLTSACEVRCPHCYLRNSPLLQEEADSIPVEVPAEVVIASMERIVPYGLAYVEFSGGEPMLHPQISELVMHALDLGVPVYVLTSGIGYDVGKALGALSQHPRKHRLFVQVSLDGHTDAVLRRMRPKASLAQIAKLIDFCHQNAVTVQTNTLIAKPNMAHLYEIAGWAESHGVKRVLFSKSAPLGRDIQCARRISLAVNDYLHIKNVVLPRINQQLSSSTAYASYLDLPYVGPSAACACSRTAVGQRGRKKRRDQWRISCAAGVLECAISPSCTLLPCAQMGPCDHSIGESLKHHDILELWHNSSSLACVRNVAIPEECMACGYSEQCSKGCHALKKSIGFDLSSPDPYCFYIPQENKVDWELARRVVPRAVAP